MEKQNENMMIMGTIFGNKKKELFSKAFGILKHPMYKAFFNNFLSVMTTSYRKGVD